MIELLVRNSYEIDWALAANVATVLGAIVAVVGVVVIWRQIRESRSISSGQLISALDTDFKSHHLEVFSDVLITGSPIKEGEGSKATLRICSYLTFFEKLYFLYKGGMLEFDMLDRLYAYRFLSVVNDRNVQDMVLYDPRYGPYLASIGCLYTEWSEYRKNGNLPIPSEKSALDPLRMERQAQESDPP